MKTTHVDTMLVQYGFHARGLRLELLQDDGSDAFARRREAARQGPVVE